MPLLPKDLKDIRLEGKLNKQEIVRALRLAVTAELEAINVYEMIADATDMTDIAEVVDDIANEEKIHVGEFLKLIEKIAPDEMEAYNKGGDEAGNKSELPGVASPTKPAIEPRIMPMAGPEFAASFPTEEKMLENIDEEMGKLLQEEEDGLPRKE
jgi:rubrerythrin